VIEGRITIWVNREVAIAELSEDRIRARVPTRPAERRISIHIFYIDRGTCFQEKLDGRFAAERSGSMKRRFTLRSAVSHESSSFS
jgi:hypothetical protein